jgi:hypothetical protein
MAAKTKSVVPQACDEQCAEGIIVVVQGDDLLDAGDGAGEV